MKSYAKRLKQIETSRKASEYFSEPSSHVGSLLAWISTLSPELRALLFVELGKRYHRNGRVKIRLSNEARRETTG